VVGFKMVYTRQNGLALAWLKQDGGQKMVKYKEGGFGLKLTIGKAYFSFLMLTVFYFCLVALGFKCSHFSLWNTVLETGFIPPPLKIPKYYTSI
jgi:hypothetical protein